VYDEIESLGLPEPPMNAETWKELVNVAVNTKAGTA
jgi:hypothetical protein